MPTERPSIETVKALQAEHRLRDVHLVYVDATGFTIAHTDEERATINLEECDLHKWLHAQDDAPEEPGYYIVMPHAIDAYSESYPVAEWDFEPWEDRDAPSGDAQPLPGDQR